MFIEVVKSAQVFVVLLKGARIIGWNWASTLILLWPIFYIYFGIYVILICHFMLKVAGAICCMSFSKNEGKEKR